MRDIKKKHIKLAHGSGGTLTHKLISESILKHFDSIILQSLPDSARIGLDGSRFGFTTDSYVVDPIFFPGGDIGKLAVCGTVNDLAVSGYTPLFLSCAMIMEEGLPMSELDDILLSMSETAKSAGVEVVTGDTKVVPKGKTDRIFINTAGIGVWPKGLPEPVSKFKTGLKVLVTGPVGDHGAAVMAAREGFGMESVMESDCASVIEPARIIYEHADEVAFMRDVTRGGLATVLCEAAEKLSDAGIVINENEIPVRDEVRSISELLGIDPLYLACEGRIAAVVDAASADVIIDKLSVFDVSKGSAIIGEISHEHPGKLVMRTPYGTRRLLQMLSGEQLPRIC